MPVPGSNIRTLRMQMGLSIRDLSKETGIDLGNLSKLEAGKIGYSKDVMERIAKVLNVSLGVLFADPGVVEAAALRMRQAPLLTSAQLTKWKGPDEFEDTDEQVYLHLGLERASRFVFALVADDGRNEPEIRTNDELIFDAAAKPKNGSFVAAQDAAGAVFIGRLRKLPAPRGESPFEVIPIHDFSHCASSQASRDLKVRGTLVELRRHL